MKTVLKYMMLLLALVCAVGVSGFAQETQTEKPTKFDSKTFIFGHTGDS